ncbi:MAG: class I SAM-dependent methyltransferase [Nitrospirae bacterium]|nr:class I SAM-dependent methyltransferase [Nitrospirota bacterium]
MNEDIDKFYKNYFKNKFRQFGDTPKGVDWKDKEAQSQSFKYIIDTIYFYYPSLKTFSIFEVGCGYGAFYEFLKERKMNDDIYYFGIDLVDEMITEAKTRYPELKDNLYVGEFKSYCFKKKFDFVISSGIFNVKEHIADATYEKYVLHTIELMFQLCKKGAIFNLMTPSPDYKDTRLFYPSVDAFFSFIYKNLSRKVTIVTSYPLWKITVGIFK